MTFRKSLDDFLLPEAAASLKVVFDNVRNYLIVASFLAVAGWLSSGAPRIPAYAVGEKFSVIAPTLSILVGLLGFILGMLNLLQTIRIAGIVIWPAFMSFIDASIEAHRIEGPWMRRARFAVLLAFFTTAAVALAIFGLACVVALAYVVIYTALGKNVT